LYYFPSEFVKKLPKVMASARGEFEITSLVESYLGEDILEVQYLRRGTAWFDAGTVDSLSRATEFVRVIQERQGTLIGSPDEASWRVGNISHETLHETAEKSKASKYGELLNSALQS
jgi:glucose-1-phosphate thymidylyltransferase